MFADSINLMAQTRYGRCFDTAHRSRGKFTSGPAAGRLPQPAQRPWPRPLACFQVGFSFLSIFSKSFFIFYSLDVFFTAALPLCFLT